MLTHICHRQVQNTQRSRCIWGFHHKCAQLYSIQLPMQLLCSRLVIRIRPRVACVVQGQCLISDRSSLFVHRFTVHAQPRTNMIPLCPNPIQKETRRLFSQLTFEACFSLEFTMTTLQIKLRGHIVCALDLQPFVTIYATEHVGN